MKKEIQNISSEIIVERLVHLNTIASPVPFTLKNNIGLRIDEIKRIYKGYQMTQVYKNSNLYSMEARLDTTTIVLLFQDCICIDSYMSMDENEEIK